MSSGCLCLVNITEVKETERICYDGWLSPCGFLPTTKYHISPPSYRACNILFDLGMASLE
jgi:hypothetical protein